MTRADWLGNSYVFTTVTSVITNNRAVPIHIKLDVFKEYDYTTQFGNRKYIAVLLLEELTPNTETLINPNTKEVGGFLDAGLYKTPYVLNKTLEPDEKCVVTTGTLRPSCETCGVIPIA